MKHSRFIAIVLLFVMVSNISADAYSFSETRKDSPADFNSFLNSCSPYELYQMMNALRETGEATPEAIRKALVWRAYNKTTYMFRGDSEVDYHSILQWAAGKSGIDSKTIEYSPTYTLEKAVAEKYFAKLWENMTLEQREELIKNVIKNEDGKFRSKVGDALKDPNLRDQVMYFITMHPKLAAAIIGGAVALLVGTFGMFGIAAGGIWLAWSESDTVSAFIMTVNVIKTRRYKN